MRIRVLAIFLVFTFLALSVAQVFAGVYLDPLLTPIIFSSGTPALSGDLMSGIIVVGYADYGSSATLSPPLVINGPIVLRLCGTGSTNLAANLTGTSFVANLTIANFTGAYRCTNVVAHLTDVGPYAGGTRPGMESYLYSFVVPSSPSGAVMVIVPTKSLVDDYARRFPAVDTQILTYATPAMSPPASNPSIPGSPSGAQAPKLYKLAPEIDKPAVSSSYIPLGLLILGMAAIGLVLSRKH